MVRTHTWCVGDGVEGEDGGGALVGDAAVLLPVPVLDGAVERSDRVESLTPPEARLVVDPGTPGVAVGAVVAVAEEAGDDAIRDVEMPVSRPGGADVPAVVRAGVEEGVSGADTAPGPLEEAADTAARVNPPPRTTTAATTAARRRFLL
jgi:hypothetical protein